AVTLVVQTTNAWAVTLLVRHFGLPLSSAGMLFGAVVVLAAPLGQFAGGRLLDRRTRGDLPGGRLLLGVLVGTLPLSAAVCLADNLALATAALAALVFGLGIGSVTTLAGLQIMTPRSLRGRVTAPFMAGITLAGFGLGPPLVGLMADRVFGEAGLGRALLATSGLAYVTGIVALLLSARYLTTHTTERARTAR
ncbi:MFS transporter, partial [Methylobacterium frigidaeris]